MNIHQVVKNNLCLGCGICSLSGEGIKMEYSKKRGMNLPKLDSSKDYEVASELCPGKGYDIVKDGTSLFGDANYSLNLGQVFSSYAAYSKHKHILKGASSGGVMSQLLISLLKDKIVDKVAVTKFEYTPNGPRTKTFLTSNIEDIIESQGSKYCPVDISNFLLELELFQGKVAYVGTPCQIAGIRQLQKINPLIGKKVFVTIANFCGGFKNYKNIEKIASRHGVNYNKISFFRFRGGGQPGSLLMKDSLGNQFEAPYPSYTAYTGYSKILRCHLCVDATGELADISCGDAWLERYVKDERTWSLVLCRSEFGDALINTLAINEDIFCEPISKEEVELSQFTNLYSKKERQLSRFTLYQKLGYKVPQFDGGYSLKRTSMLVEVKVFFSHWFKETLEKLGLYKLFRIILRKKY